MEIQITGRHFDASQELQKYVREKIILLERYYNNIISADVILDYVGDHKRMVEVNVKIKNKTINAKSEENTMSNAINHTMERLITQLKKENDKRHKH